MATSYETSTVNKQRSGRSYFWAGIVLCLLGVAIFFVLIGLKIVVDPWYVPILTTVGVLLLFASVIQRRTAARLIVFALILALAVFEWYAMVVPMSLPDYTGPAQAGTTIPAFQTARADGIPFTEKDLQNGTSHVLLFFRGRW